MIKRGFYVDMPSTVVIIVWYEGGLLSLSTVLWKEKGCNVVSLLFVTLMDTCAQCLLHLNLQGRWNRVAGGADAPPQILADQLTLPILGEDADFAPNVTTCPDQVFRPSYGSESPCTFSATCSRKPQVKKDRQLLPDCEFSGTTMPRYLY